MIKFNEKRLGQIRVTPELIETIESRNDLALLFQYFTPLQTIWDKFFTERVIIYIGYSKHFDIVSEGEVTPFYDAFFSTDDDGNVKFERFERCDLFAKTL